MLRFDVGLKANAVVRVPQVYRQNPKNEFFGGKWPLFGKISKICSESFHDITNSRFVFKFHGKRVHGEVGGTMRCFADKKVRKMRFFGAISRRFSGGRQKFATGACHVIPRLPVKFRPNRFFFVGVIPGKVISYIVNVCVNSAQE